MSDDKKIKLTDGSDLTYVAPSGAYSFAVNEYDCPVCGIVKCFISVTLGDPELDGTYCQKCYAKWVNKNLPRIVKRQ
jgi:hypothetical protein